MERLLCLIYRYNNSILSWLGGKTLESKILQPCHFKIKFSHMGLSPNPQGMSPIGSLGISFFAVFGERPDVPKALSIPPPRDVLEVEFSSKMK